MSPRFLQIDEEGYFLSMGLRISDEDYGYSLFENMKVDGRGYVTLTNAEPVIIEAFDQPLVARHIEPLTGGLARVDFPYGFSQTIRLDGLRADFWDRFHARTVERDLPVVFSRAAQMDLFNAADSFDDDSLTIDDVNYPVSEFYPSEQDASAPNFWAKKYADWQNAGDKPGWELGGATPLLDPILTQIKIPRSRIGILGCGVGHDAAALAERGHIVTGVDWSEAAIAEAEKKYGLSRPDLRFVNEEAFDFAKQNPMEFDVIFEHTFFCAISPARREKLVQAWSRMLVPGGHLLGIFFVLDNAPASGSGDGPPFGVTEWEVRELLKQHFDFLYWTRAKNSIPKRLGKELIVYAKKRG